MLKISRIFFYHLLIVLGALFIFISLLSYYGIKNIEIANFSQALKKEILLLEEMPKLRDDIIRKLDRKLDRRITIVDLLGNVIAESRYDKNKMENHLYRPEIRQALQKGWGVSERYSVTLHTNFLYVAKRSGDRFIRLAYPLERIRNSYFGLWLKFLGLFMLFVFIAVLVSFVSSRRIEQDIEKIVEYLKALANKNYTKKIHTTFSEEFVTISEHLHSLAKKLAKREEKKAKFTKKLKQISRQRNELISAISHEFKNPVAIIDGYAQTLLEDEQMPVHLRRRFIQKIHKASKKISFMIDRLALAMKFESGNLSLDKSSFDLCALTKEVAEFLGQKYKERKIVIKCEPAIVEADKAMMEMVISNLLDNALKYSEDNVEIVIKNRRFCVIDKGIGIEPEYLDKITKKFYRVHHSWDNSMGLGLFIVDYILKLHGTKLEIASEVGKGSRFCFALERMHT